MIRLLTTLLCSCVMLAVSAQGIQFFEGSYEEALQTAEQENKLIFVDAYAVWCGPCKRMSNQVFPREDVGAFYNEHFISLKINMESKEGMKFGSKFPVSSYPTLLYLNPAGELVQRVVGAQQPDNLIKQGQGALQRADNSADFAKRYQAGERDPETVLAYIRSLNRAGKPSLAIANEFLRDHKNYTDKKVLPILFESMVQADSRIFDIFIENRAALEAAYGAPVVADRIEAAATATLKNGLTYDSDKLVEQAKQAIAEHLPNRANGFEAHADFEVAKLRKDSGLAYKAAKKVVLAGGNTAAANNQMANELYQYFEGQPKAMKLATRMAGMAAKVEPTFNHLFTYARLLDIGGKTRKALSQAELARKKLGADNADPRQLAMVKELIGELERKS